jgi:heat shock protein HslJ
MSDDGDRLIESRLEQLWQEELAGAEGYRPEPRGSRPPRAGVLGQLVAAVVLVVLVGGLFYVSPMGPGGRSSTATPTPYPGEPTRSTLETPTLPPWLQSPAPPIVLQRYSVDASAQTGDLLMPGATLEIGLGDNGLGYSSVMASAGCNYISGSYSITGGVLVVTELGMTLIGCEEQQAAQDDRIAQLLQSRPKIDWSDSTLVLTTPDLTLTLTRLPDVETPTPAAQPPLSISNNTTLDVNLVVNGAPVGVFGPGEYHDPITNVTLPELPWTVEARTQSGRVLVSFTVQPGTVSSTAYPGGVSEANGAGARADLSCGRLDVWSGPPMLGPAPPPSFPPHDCDP